MPLRLESSQCFRSELYSDGKIHDFGAKLYLFHRIAITGGGGGGVEGRGRSRPCACDNVRHHALASGGAPFAVRLHRMPGTARGYALLWGDAVQLVEIAGEVVLVGDLAGAREVVHLLKGLERAEGLGRKVAST